MGTQTEVEASGDAANVLVAHLARLHMCHYGYEQ